MYTLLLPVFILNCCLTNYPKFSHWNNKQVPPHSFCDQESACGLAGRISLRITQKAGVSVSARASVITKLDREKEDLLANHATHMAAGRCQVFTGLLARNTSSLSTWATQGTSQKSWFPSEQMRGQLNTEAKALLQPTLKVTSHHSCHTWRSKSPGPHSKGGNNIKDRVPGGRGHWGPSQRLTATLYPSPAYPFSSRWSGSRAASRRRQLQSREFQHCASRLASLLPTMGSQTLSTGHNPCGKNHSEAFSF